MPLTRLKLKGYELTDSSDTLIRSLIGSVSAGHPLELGSEEELVDLNKLVRRGSSHTMFIQVEGDSMCDEIRDGDWVTIALDKEPQPNDIVIARLNDGYTIKRFKLNNGHRRGLYLVPANATHKPREVIPADEARILGVVTFILKKAA